jgi:sorbitol-specific phosphotransferase system component IIBC
MATVMKTQLMQTEVNSSHRLFLALSTKVMNRVIEYLFFVDSRHPETVISNLILLFIAFISLSLIHVITDGAYLILGRAWIPSSDVDTQIEPIIRR